jgi:hypothetical protein
LHTHLFLLNDAAIHQVDGAIGNASVAWVVGDHANRGAVGVQLAQQVHHRFAIFRIEISGWLIRKQNRGLTSQRTRYGNPLLLAA